MLDVKFNSYPLRRNGRDRRYYFGNLVESEGVLMIIAYDALFGYVNIIVFQLANRIALASKSSEAVYEESKNMFAFSYPAIPTRHTVSVKLIG